MLISSKLDTINSRNSKSLKINLKAPFTELFFCPNLKKLNKMSVVLFDPEFRSQLFPLAMTRSVADFRIGISTIKEKWEKYLGNQCQCLTPDYLQSKYTNQVESELYVNAAVLPNDEIQNAITDLNSNEALYFGVDCISFKTSIKVTWSNLSDVKDNLKKIEYKERCFVLKHNWQIFKIAGTYIQKDIELFDFNKLDSKHLVENNQVFGKYLYADPTVKAKGCIFNTDEGPIYLAKGVEVMEGTVIRGPFAILEDSTVKLAAKIYGPTIIGPHCKVGGEISNSILFGYSNKAHDGFIGNTVVGEWCNLGADTNTSNLKNNYSQVRVYDYSVDSEINTEEQFCGLMMGDHSMTGINTMLNTGAVVGISSNVFGGGFPQKHIPSFSWGGENLVKFKLDKAIEVATKMMERRNVSFTDSDLQILTYIFDNYGLNAAK